MDRHFIQLPRRTGTCDIIEEEKRILCKLTFSKYGDFGDDKEIMAWLVPIFGVYDNDNRPLVMDNPTTGERATVFGDTTNSAAIIEPPMK